MGTLEQKWGPNGDPKTEKGPHGDRVPQMGTHVGTVGITELGMCQDNEKHNLQPPQSSDIYFPSSFIQLVCLF